MYPIPARLTAAAFLYLSFAALLQKIHAIEASLLTPYTLVGIWSVFSLLLVLRLMDEFKDREIDRTLFRNRPLPSGRVLESDLAISLMVVAALFVAANVWVGAALWAALVALGYAFLMFRYFFIPNILRSNLLFTLVTHNPIIPIMLFYVVVLFSVEHGLTLRAMDGSSTLLLMALYWAPSFAWEIARKIRAREEENAYVTYSQILGRPGAVLLAGGTQTIALGIGLYLYLVLGLSAVFLVVLLTGYILAMGGHARFLLHPTPTTSRLRPFAEGYLISLFVAGLLDFVITTGFSTL